MKFPDSFPEHCPLSSARDCNDTVYMIVQQLPPTETQCRTQAERGRAASAIGIDACKRMGLSVFPDFAACHHQRELMPYLGRHIAVAKLRPEHGKIASTPTRNPAHHTWWSYEGVQRHALFTSSEEG